MDTVIPEKAGEGKTKRVFLRIPIRLPAKIIMSGYPDKEVCLEELSTTGLSFYLKESESIPDSFEITFQLKHFSKIIKVKLEVKSRINVPGGWRVGCRLAEISDEDKRSITNYICKFADLSVPIRIVSSAAFFCALDSLWRIAAYFLYYEGVKFEEAFKISLTDHLYFVVLLVYALCSFTAFIFSGRLLETKAKMYFLISLSCLIPPFLFIMFKDIAYWKFWMWSSENISIGIFFWSYVLLTFYTGLSIVVGARALKKTDLVLGILDQHVAPPDAQKIKT